MGNNAFHFLDVVAHGLLYCAGLPAREEAQVQPAHVIEDTHTQAIERMEGAGVADEAAGDRERDANDDACHRDTRPQPCSRYVYSRIV